MGRYLWCGVHYYNGEIYGVLSILRWSHWKYNKYYCLYIRLEYYFNKHGYTQYIPSKNVGVVSIGEVGTAKKNYSRLNHLNIESIVDDRIRFNFGSLNHSSNSSRKNRYSIKIEGNDYSSTKIIENEYYDWYPNNTGEYQFSVQSIDRDLNYSNKDSILLNIINPWYSRASFLPIFGIFSIFLLFHSLHIQILKQKEFSRKLIKDRQKKDKEAREILENKNIELQESQKPLKQLMKQRAPSLPT